MQFTKLLVAATTFVFASAQTVKFTNTNFSGITVGSPFNITWSGATSDITLKLKNGPTNAQLLFETIASKLSKSSSLKSEINCFAGGLTGTFYVWTPDSTIVDGIYNLEIDHDSDPPNYSIQFTISGGLLSSSSASSATSASVASSVTSTAASVTTTSTSTASRTSTVSGNSSVSVTSSSTIKSSKLCYVDETIESTNDNLGSSSTTSSPATTSVPSSNNAAQYASPFAFVLMSFVAIAALN
jgi:hypothetical protein